MYQITKQADNLYNKVLPSRLEVLVALGDPTRQYISADIYKVC